MRGSVLARVALVALAVLCAPPCAPASQTVRWDPSTAGSSKGRRDGRVVKRLESGGVVVTASVVDAGTWIVVELEVDNTGARAIDVRPDGVTVDVVDPLHGALAMISADKLAQQVEADGFFRASSTEASGSLATKTVVTTTTTEEPISGIPDPTNPLQQTIPVTHTTVETVPDESARNDASFKAIQIRNEASFDAAQIRRDALHPAVLNASGSVKGDVFFAPDRRARAIVVRVSAGAVVYEIPFKKASRRFFLLKPPVYE
jgi:hypothetical protein